MRGAPTEVFDSLGDETSRLRRAGVRRLLVLSGEGDWCLKHAAALRDRLSGDWLWVGAPQAGWQQVISPTALKSLLGREFTHGVFDARQGLAVDALAALAGTLRAGSWLVLLAPPWSVWPARPDNDALRFCERTTPVATPHFITYLRQRLLADPDVVVLRPHQNAVYTPLAARPDWQPPAPGPTDEQWTLLQRLLAADKGIFVLTAPRGRGKSTLAGMLAARAPGRCWVTAPAKNTVAVLDHYARRRARFFAPDALLEYCQTHLAPGALSDDAQGHAAPGALSDDAQRHAARSALPDDGQNPLAPDWLLVDEAAAIPTPLLRALISYFPRVLLTTTVQGYEGTGQGFLLKFCAALPSWRHFTLNDPLRFAADDPLERWLAATLLFTEPGLAQTPVAEDRAALVAFDQTHWQTHPADLQPFYQLMAGAHYRTTPLDLRRLLDAPGQHFIAARVNTSVVGALWAVDEGGLSLSLAHDVWAGRRRPPGNLVAQSLAAHAGLWTAPTLRSRRISRIAVLAHRRRRGLGRELVARAVNEAQGLDFISVSFGFTGELWRFWRSAGFQLVHMGSHLEASSGCYSAMALYPLSADGHRLTRQAAALFARNAKADDPAAPTTLNNGPMALSADRNDRLNEDDWRALAGFAFGQRPPESCRAALNRLIRQCALPMPALRSWLSAKREAAEIVRQTGVSGKKALVARWRDETADALETIDTQACLRWREWTAPGGYDGKVE